MRKYINEHQHFGFRKLSVGLAGVLLSTTFLIAGGHNNTVKADTTDDGHAPVENNKAPEETSKSVVEEANKTAEGLDNQGAASQASQKENMPASQKEDAQASHNATQNAEQQASQTATNLIKQDNSQAKNDAAQVLDKQAENLTKPTQKTPAQKAQDRRNALLFGVSKADIPVESLDGKTIDRKATVHVTINYHYADKSLKDMGSNLDADGIFKVDQDNAGKQFKKSDNFDLVETYKSTYHKDSNTTDITDYTTNIDDLIKNNPDLAISRHNTAKILGLEVNGNIYQGADSADVNSTNYAAVLVNKNNGLNRLSSRINDNIVGAAIGYAPIDFEDGSATLKGTDNGKLNASYLLDQDLTYDVYIYERPFKTKVTYTNRDDNKSLGSTIADDYTYLPELKKQKQKIALQSPDTDHVLVDPSASSINLSYASPASVNVDSNPNIGKPTLTNMDDDFNKAVPDGVYEIAIPVQTTDRIETFDPHGGRLPDGGHDPHYPDGFTKDNFQKDVTRNIIVKGLPGGDQTTPETVTIGRTGTYNYATKEMTYSNPVLMENGELTNKPAGFDTKTADATKVGSDGKTYEIVGATVVPGYTFGWDAYTATKKPKDVVFQYQVKAPDTVSKVAQLVDVDAKDSAGKHPVVASTTLTGAIGSSAKINLPVPEGYELVPGTTIPASYQLKANDPAPLVYNVQHKHQDVSDTDPNAKKDFKRIISVTNPDASVNTTTQTVTLKRSADKDMVTGQVTYGEWNTGEFKEFVPPVIEGYKPTMDKVATEKVTADNKPVENVAIAYNAVAPAKVNQDIQYINSDTKKPIGDPINIGTDVDMGSDVAIPQDTIPKGFHLPEGAPTTVKATGKTVNVEVAPDPVKQGQDIIYVDPQGDPVAKETLPGKDGDKIPSDKLNIPDGWVIDDGNPNVPAPGKEITVDTKTPLEVPIKHGVVIVKPGDVTPDKPIKKGDLIPGTKDQHFGQDITNDDLNKDITRTINFQVPGKPQQVVQKLHATREVAIDTVTGLPVKDDKGNTIGYSKWVLSDGKKGFDAVDAPEVDGYTPSMKTVPAQAIDPNTAQDSVVNVAYTKNPAKPTAGKPNTGNGGGATSGGNVTPDVPSTPAQTPQQPTQPTQPSAPSEKPAEKPDETPAKTPAKKPAKNNAKKDKPLVIGYFDAGNNNGKQQASRMANNGLSTIKQTPATAVASPVMQVAQASHAPQGQAQATQLPQTGAKDGFATVALGLALISLSAVGFATRKRN